MQNLRVDTFSTSISIDHLKRRSIKKKEKKWKETHCVINVDTGFHFIIKS